MGFLSCVFFYTFQLADSSTPTGKAPDIARYEQYGLCCASFVTYYLCNYLPIKVTPYTKSYTNILITEFLIILDTTLFVWINYCEMPVNA